MGHVCTRSASAQPPSIGFPGEAAGTAARVQALAADRAGHHGLRPRHFGVACCSWRAPTPCSRATAISCRCRCSGVDAPPAGKRVISPQTARAVRAMLEMRCSPAAPRRRAQVRATASPARPAPRTSWRTGGYADQVRVLLRRLAPASDPRLVIAVMIDEPSAGQYYGGAVAAPVFAQVMAGCAAHAGRAAGRARCSRSSCPARAKRRRRAPDGALSTGAGADRRVAARLRPPRNPIRVNGPASGPVRGTGEPGRDDRARLVSDRARAPGSRVLRLSRRRRRRPQVHRRRDRARRRGGGVGVGGLRLGPRVEVPNAGVERTQAAPGRAGAPVLRPPVGGAVDVRRDRHQRQDHLLTVDRGGAAERTA